MTEATRLPTPGAAVASDPAAAAAWVARQLGHLTAEPPEGVRASPELRGGQRAADAALALLDIAGYARRRNEVWPPERRGASRLSPYVRHGLLTLPRLWRAVATAPPADRAKYRDELLWQEYARHVYARVGRGTRLPLRREPPRSAAARPDDPWPRSMRCLDLAVQELERDGWLVNQTRMWLASQWTVRAGWDWREGEDRFFRHLLDGSRAANRLGWQWTVGTGTGKPYGFSRWQVRKRAPGLCEGCALRDDCPIEDWPEADPGEPTARQPPGLRRGEPGAGPGAGPREVERSGTPDAVWLTFESLGDDDPALRANPELPVVVVFDEPLLGRLRLSGKRLVFVVETLAELAERRDVELHLGRPADVLARRAVAVTAAPVPGFATLRTRVAPAECHPWPWLLRPGTGPAQSFTAWRRSHPSPAPAD